MKWGLLGGLLVLVVAVPYFYRHVDERIRCHVEETLAADYPEFAVSVGFAELVEGEGIRIRDVSLVEPGTRGPGAECVHLEEVFLVCRTDLEELIAGKPNVTKVVIRRPTLRATRRPDGTWNSLQLPTQSTSTSGQHAPEVNIEDGTVEIFDLAKRSDVPLSLRHVQLTFRPMPAQQLDALQDGPSNLSSSFPSNLQPDTWREKLPGSQPQPQSRPYQLEATFDGDFFRRARVQGFVDPKRLDWRLDGSIEGLDVSPQQIAMLPGASMERLSALGALHGQATVWFQAGQGATRRSPCQFDVACQLVRGRLDNPRLARPLTDVRAAFRLNNAGFTVDRFSAACGQATLELSCHAAGHAPNVPFSLDAKIRDLELDRQLAGMFPEPLGEAWRKFLPAGRVHADVKLDHDGRTWKPELTVQCLDASFCHEKFPYRLTQCTGSITLKNDELAADVIGYAGTQPVRITCLFSDPMGGPCGWIEARGENILLDQKLYNAMSEQSRAVVRSFDPRGTVNGFFRLWHDDPRSPVHRRLVVSLNRIHARHEKFPYPLSNVRATLDMLDGQWTCRDLTGTNDTAVLRGEGRWTSGDSDGGLAWRLTASDVPLEEELRDALRSEPLRQLWNDLGVRGMVDLNIQIHREAGQREPTISIHASPQSEKTSIEPACFPYRLEKVGGQFHYDAGLVTVERFKAEHGQTKIASAGRCRFLPEGGWQLQLDQFTVDQLRADRELIRALPGRLRECVTKLNPGGPLDLRGILAFSREPQDSRQPRYPRDPRETQESNPDQESNSLDAVRSQWDLNVGFHRGSLDVGVKLENLHGEVALAGEFDGQKVQSRAELALDSLTYRGVQFTEVMGPIWIDDRQILFGSSVDGYLAADKPRDVTARVFDGTVFGRGRVGRTDPANWRVRANLSQCDLRRCAQELFVGRQDLRGKLRATIDLWGAGHDRNTLGGMGRAELRDADIGELPVMIALLKILSIQEPDASAFDESDVDFTIKGPRVHFSQIHCNGDAVSLEGKGEMDLDTAVRLTFHARLGRRQLGVPLLEGLLGSASDQIMRIHVGGTLNNPITTKEPFPTVNQALQLLQPDPKKAIGTQENYRLGRLP